MKNVQLYFSNFIQIDEVWITRTFE